MNAKPELFSRYTLVKSDRFQKWIINYREERLHQSLEKEPHVGEKNRRRPKTNRGKIEGQILPLNEVRCKQRLGGLLKNFSRNAA